MKLVWLASYPKSGNTWLRFFLQNYFFGAPADSRDVARNIPDIHSAGLSLDRATGKLFCKTHYQWSDEHPYAASTKSFIYIMRHPKDILLSTLNYFKLDGQPPFTDAEYVQTFIERAGAPEWQDMGMGTWPGHVASWLDTNTYPRVVLRYEDLLADPYTGFRSVVEFLTGRINDSGLEQAIEASSFGKLRRIEEQEKNSGQPSAVFPGSSEAARQGRRFMNEGHALHSLAHISRELDQRFDEAFHEPLARCGYT